MEVKPSKTTGFQRWMQDLRGILRLFDMITEAQVHLVT